MAKEMLFSVVCPTCEARIGVHDQRLINQLVQCPKCGSIVQLTPPEGYAKSENSPQKVEEKPEKTTPSPEDPNSQVISEKNNRDEKKQSNNSPLPVSNSPSVPIPPPASIPVPPPVSIPEPIAPNTLMPEPMSPGKFNNTSSNGKSFSQRIGALSDKIPALAPYLIIGTGIIALISILFIFFFSGSRKDVNNFPAPPAVEISNANDETKDVTKPALNAENKSEDSVPVEEKSGDNIDNSNPFNEKDDANSDIASPDENAKSDDPASAENNLDVISSEDDSNINKPIEDVDNVEEAAPVEPQPETQSNADNPFQEVEPKTDNQPEQNPPSEEIPAEDEDGIRTDEDDLTLDNLSANASNPEGNSSEDSPSDSEMSSIPGLNIKLTSISIREQKLSQCLQTIRELGALPIDVNWDSLRRNGVNADDKISWSGKDVTLKTALTEVLAQRGLMFKINEDGKIVFVPRVSINARTDSSGNSGQQSGSAMVKAQYSVSDLVGQSPEKTAELMKSIREFLCPGDWKEVGGTGTITASGGGSILIMQSQHNQWIIADFLDRLRLARHLAPLYNRDASLELMSVRAQSALKRNVGINFQPTADLKTALSEIGQRISVNILLDEPSLKIAGISAQFPISFDAREMSLEETFNRIKEETGLTFLAQTPNSFIVTTPQGAKSMMTVEFFPISDLVNIGLTPAVLMEQIVKFEPKSWKSQDAASFGLIDYDANSDCLIIRQSSSVLSKISDLLTQLRARLKAKE